MNIVDYNRLIGGIDCRLAFDEEKENRNFTFWTDAQNIEVDNGLIQKMSGCTNILTTDLSGAILGGFEYEVNNVRYMVFSCGDGNFYLFNGDGTYTSKKSGLNKSEKVNYTQYLNKLVVLNGVDEAFIYDKTREEVKSTNILKHRNIVGTCAASYQGRLWIAEGATLYFSDLGDPTEWRNDPDNSLYGGYISNFQGNTDTITALSTYGEYLAIYAGQKVYLLSGSTPDDFQIIPFGEMGIYSPFVPCNFDKKQFFISSRNLGIYFLGQFGDLGQLQISDELSKKIKPSLNNIDISRQNQIYMVPYPLRNQIWIYIPVKGNNNLTTTWIMDFNYSAYNPSGDFVCFYKRVGKPVTCAFTYNNKIYTGTEDGKIYLEDSGATFDGESITAYVYFPFFDFGERSMYKSCQYLKMWVNQQKANNFELVTRYNRDLFNQLSNNINIDNPFMIWGQDSWGSKNWAKNTETSQQATIDKEFTSIQIGLKCNNATDDFSLRAISFIDLNDLNEA